MSEEKRKALPPIPDNITAVLSPDQILSLRRIEGFGWDLHFVRRQNIPVPIVVVSDPGGKKLGVLEPDGRLNLEHKLKIR